MILSGNAIPRDIVFPFKQKTVLIHLGDDELIVERHWDKDLYKGCPRYSYGLSYCGYDVRVKQGFWLWPLKGRLASTIERFKMPLDVVGTVHDKSSWARRMVAVQNTVIEPGWEGYLTLELSNNTWKPIYIPAGVPIAQILFHRIEAPMSIGYQGKYQNQIDAPQEAL